jgi:glycosyltransferase involved in cell wall biosynthesis
MVDVSGIVITLNEEPDIENALRSLSWCQEIIVVDSGSTDRTVEICEAYGCEVIQREFSDYGEQKRFAVSQARNDWILSIDADEVISPALTNEIQRELSKETLDYRGYFLPISLVLWDGVIRGRRRYTKPKLRLFDRRHGNFNRAKVHESVKVSGPCKHLRHEVYHCSYSSIFDYFQKFNCYTSASALEKFNEDKSVSAVPTVLRFPFEFLKLYLVQGFFIDGWQGFVWSLFSSLYPVVRNIKLLELQRTHARRERLPARDALASSPPVVTGVALESRAL